MIGIYKITNPTGKIYIGQSIHIESRWKGYKLYPEGCKSQTILYNSFIKYGVEAHKFEIVEECSKDKLLERETWWKLFYRVLDKPSLCCRIDGKSGSLSQETKDRMSISNKGISRNKGRIQSEEERKLRSKIKKGTKHTKEHNENHRKSMIGKNVKSIICLNNKKIYNSIREASQTLNINERIISNILRGVSKQTINNYKFKYA